MEVTTRLLEAFLICGRKYLNSEIEYHLQKAISILFYNGVLTGYDLLLLYLLSLGLKKATIANLLNIPFTTFLNRLRRPLEIIQFYVGGVTNDRCFIERVILYKYGDPFEEEAEALSSLLKKGILDIDCVENRNYEDKGTEMYSQTYI